MPVSRTFSEIRLVNGSTGDPVLFIDYPGKDDAFLFDAGELGSLDPKRLSDLEAVFLTHHHMDHFVGFDRILRANLDRDKVLHIFGPVNTIGRVYDRIKSYEIQHFPFQKVVFQVHEIEPSRDGSPFKGVKRSALLECVRKFPTPEIVEGPWHGPVIYDTAELAVEAAPTDHTVPGLAFALVEKVGFHPDPARLATGTLRPGGWISHVLDLLRKKAPPDTIIDIDGGRFALGLLGEMYFARSRGARVAYVTDTFWSEAVQPGLIKLAHRAHRLYCDSYYSESQAKDAAKHRHMTATRAAEYAAAARVDQLILMHFGSRYSGRYHELLDEARAIFPRVSAVFP
jgi:ribonuclease Z